MNGRRLTFTYLVTYLTVGGLGLAIAPDVALDLLQSDGNYGDIMPRLAGLFMVVLGLLLLMILRFEDWKYYPIAIYARVGIVLFLAYLYFSSDDPLFLVVEVIVLIGLLPSIYVHYFQKKELAAST